MSLFLNSYNCKCYILDLTKECERLKEMGGGSKNAEEGGGVLGEELQVVRSERDSAVMEGKSLRQTVTQLGNEKQVWLYV